MLEENKKEALILFLDYIFKTNLKNTSEDNNDVNKQIEEINQRLLKIEKQVQEITDINIEKTETEPEKPKSKENEVTLPQKVVIDGRSIGTTIVDKKDNYKEYITEITPIMTEEQYNIELNKLKSLFGKALNRKEEKQVVLGSKLLSSFKVKQKFPEIETYSINKELNNLVNKGILTKYKLDPAIRSSPVVYASIKDKPVKPKEKQMNGKQYHKNIKNNPDGEFKFTKTYKQNRNYKIRDDGVIALKNYPSRELCESYQLLKLFEKIKEFPILNNNIIELRQYTRSFTSEKTGMELLYSINTQMQSGHGDKIDLIYECYKNEQYANPIFKNVNKEVRINDIGTGISPFTISNWITEISGSYNPKYTIIKLIHENVHKNCTRKELSTILMNWNNNSLLKILNTDKSFYYNGDSNNEL